MALSGELVPYYVLLCTQTNKCEMFPFSESSKQKKCWLYLMASSSPGFWFYVSAGIVAISDLNAT